MAQLRHKPPHPKYLSAHRFGRLNSLFAERFEQLPNTSRAYAQGEYHQIKQVPVLTRAQRKTIDQVEYDLDRLAAISNFHAARAYAANFEHAYSDYY